MVATMPSQISIFYWTISNHFTDNQMGVNVEKTAPSLTWSTSLIILHQGTSKKDDTPTPGKGEIAKQQNQGCEMQRTAGEKKPHRLPKVCFSWNDESVMTKSGMREGGSSCLLRERERVCVCVRACSVVSDSVRPHGLQSTRFLCPWDFPGKNTGVGCHFLLQGIFQIQWSNPCLSHLLHWQEDSLPRRHWEVQNGLWIPRTPLILVGK